MATVLALFAGHGAWAGPIRGPIPAARVLDEMEDAGARAQQTEGTARLQVEARTGIARAGNGSLLLRLGATEAGRNIGRLTWAFLEAQEWSAFEGVTFWYQALGGEETHAFHLIVLEGKGVSYRCGVSSEPRRVGQWQQLRVPFTSLKWNWEGAQDADNTLNRERVAGLRLDFPVAPGAEAVFALDSLALYAPQPEYRGPRLALSERSILVAPGELMRCRMGVSGLETGQAAVAEVRVTDYRERPVKSVGLSFRAGPDGKAAAQGIHFTGRGYFGMHALLKVDGKPLWEERTGFGCVPPPDPKDMAVPPEESPFGIWVGGLEIPRKLGIKWFRQGLNDGNTIVADPRHGYVRVRDPGKPFAFQDVPGMRSTFYFAAMQKWLTSRPERADWQKWAPRDWEEYARMLTWLAERGKGVTHLFEVWNEPVPYAYWMGDMASVVKLHEVTYKALKRGNPEAVVLGPCPYTFLFPFLEDFFRLGGGQWIDHLLLHTYTKGDPDNGALRENLRRVRELARRYGPERDLYITEMGWATPDVTERQQAQYLVRSYVLCMAERVKLLTWHMLWQYQPVEEAGHAILRHDQSPRPALIAYATLVRWLQRAQYVGEAPGLAPTQRGFVFRKDGRDITVLWDCGKESTLYRLRGLPGAVGAEDVMGNPVPLKRDAGGSALLTLSGDPLFVSAGREE